MTGSAADSFTADDQYDLNRYVGFIERRKELKAELKQLQDEIDGLHEAHEEMLAMDPKDAHLNFDRNYPPALGFRWAETFTDWEPAAMAEYLEDKIRQMEGQQAEMENDFREMRERMADLHQSLSSRYFGCATTVRCSEKISCRVAHLASALPHGIAISTPHLHIQRSSHLATAAARACARIPP